MCKGSSVLWGTNQLRRFFCSVRNKPRFLSLSFYVSLHVVTILYVSLHVLPIPIPPQRSPFSYMYYNRTQRWRYCQNEECKLKCSCTRRLTRERKKCKPQLNGWASWPDPAPNLSLHLQISMPILDEFVSTHGPSHIMELTQFFFRT